MAHAPRADPDILGGLWLRLCKKILLQSLGPALHAPYYMQTVEETGNNVSCYVLRLFFP